MSEHTNVQIIEQDGQPAFAVVPYGEWLEMTDQKKEPLIPHEVVSLIFEKNMSPLAAWRTHLKFTQEDIAKDLGVSQAAIAQMEKVDSKPQKKTRIKYAAALGLTIEHLYA